MPIPKIILICGATGIGKTSLAIKLAQTFAGEIVSADSMQIYRHMDIGTAKPSEDEQAKIKHHMINIVDPDQHFDAAIYAKMADDIIFKLHKQNITTFVVGGTGFYIKALIHGIFDQGNSDISIRQSIKKDAQNHSAESLHNRLKKFDPKAALKIHKNNTFRIIRAIEVYELTGKTVSEHHNKHKFAEKRFETYKIGLEADRKTIYDRINRRVDDMIEKGFVDEVKGLIEKDYSSKLKTMQSLGYRHICDFFAGRVSFDEAVRTMKQDTRRYAKRQLTWFKADPEIVWIPSDEVMKLKKDISLFL